MASLRTELKTYWKLFNLAWEIVRFKILPKHPEAIMIARWNSGSLVPTSIVNIFPGIENVDIKIKNLFLKEFDTSVSNVETSVICAIAKFKDCRKILEIGTFNGHTTLNLAANTNEASAITTIDLPENWNGKYHLNLPNEYVNVTDRNEIGIQYKRNEKYRNKITQVYGDSAALDWSLLKGPFDFIFIDGNHYRDYVLSDTKNAVEHLVPGGIIVWHDYGSIPDVSRIVDSFSGKLKISLISETRLAVGIKPNSPNGGGDKVSDRSENLSLMASASRTSTDRRKFSAFVFSFNS